MEAVTTKSEKKETNLPRDIPAAGAADADANAADASSADASGADGGQHTKQSRYFRAVVQERESGQMDVLRWLAGDDLYETCYIRHDRDIRAADADCENSDAEKGVKPGEPILPHYHLIIRTRKKCAASTMTKRFGGYVHFQIAFDPFDAARYLTHEAFRARHKYRYSRDDVQGNREFYEELLGDCAENPVQVCKRWRAYIEMGRKFPDVEPGKRLSDALDCAIQYNDERVVKSVMAHSYFYDKYFQ